MTLSEPKPAERVEHVPGEPGLWILILADLTVFAILFGSFLVDRNEAPVRFAHGSGQLALSTGVLNTFVLLTSSLLVARLVRRHAAGPGPASARLALGAIGLGGVFIAVKVSEWVHLVAVDGITPATNNFFTWYFVLTGLHLLHLLLGLSGLLVVRRVVRRVEPKPRDRMLVEGITTYWHLVDLLWLVIFPLFYVAAS